MLKPHCHIFHVDDAPYVYDVNTGDVVAVDPATVAVLAGGVSDASVADLDDARRRMSEARERDGLFLAHRPTGVAPCPDCHAPSAYDGGLRQLTLSISEQCNLRCRYCRHGHGLDGVRPHRDVRMSFDTARAAVREFLHRSRDATAPSIVCFTCKAVWRGPCASTARDKRLCQVQTGVRRRCPRQPPVASTAK